MGMNDTPSSERVHISFFGRRNAGKSSLMNAVTGQSLAVVSDIRGTTTDPVKKAMELLPLGPVVMIDTPGIDDTGELGALRVKKAYQMLNKTDVAVLVIDGTEGAKAEDLVFFRRLKEKGIPTAVVYNKKDMCEKQLAAGKSPMQGSVSSDSAPRAAAGKAEHEEVNAAPKNPVAMSGESGAEKERDREMETACGGIEKNVKPQNAALWDGTEPLPVSAVTGEGIQELKELLAKLGKRTESEKRLVGDLIQPEDLLVLVVPIDKAAPKGRLILPQQQTIRDILESGAAAIVVRDTELKSTLSMLKKKPRLVITDSQVFASAAKDTPEDILLTSFSILFARYKGELAKAVAGCRALDQIRTGDKILISEGCTHHRQCEDIGTVKLPNWIRQTTGAAPEFTFISGTEFPEDLSPYKLIVHCGACMLSEREVRYRYQCAEDQHIPITNYGILIAYMKGILKRSLLPFPEIASLLPEDK